MRKLKTGREKHQEKMDKRKRERQERRKKEKESKKRDREQMKTVLARWMATREKAQREPGEKKGKNLQGRERERRRKIWIEKSIRRRPYESGTRKTAVLPPIKESFNQPTSINNAVCVTLIPQDADYASSLNLLSGH